MADQAKLTYLVPCSTSAGTVYLNPLHIVAIEPLPASSPYKTRVRISNALTNSESDVGGEAGSSVEVLFTTDAPEEIARRTEQALHSFHHC